MLLVYLMCVAIVSIGFVGFYRFFILHWPTATTGIALGVLIWLVMQDKAAFSYWWLGITATVALGTIIFA